MFEKINRNNGEDDMMDGYLILEDGTIFEGKAFGDPKRTVCEVVFNTGMGGYVESISDPSYGAQGVVMTFPSIGNHGVTLADMESDHPSLAALIVREYYDGTLDPRADLSLDEWLKREGIPGLWDVDTRSLTRHLRDHGTMKGMLVYQAQCPSYASVRDEIKAWQMPPQVPLVGIKEARHYAPEGEGVGSGKKIAVIDYGTKLNMIRDLARLGAEIDLLPFDTKAETILAGGYDGVLLSNGPGDPKACQDQIAEIRKLVDSKVPMMAICLGHQMLALAVGLDTEKMYFGHRGGNHPVRDVETGRLYVTSQNHGYVVRRDLLEQIEHKVEVSFEHVNDETIEGLRFVDLPIETYQFHPEASPGPEDTFFLFERFLECVKG